MTKEDILIKSLDLFSKKGYYATSIDEIGEACNIKGPAIYRHYKNKEAILNAIIENIENNYAKNINQGLYISTKEEFIDFTYKMVNYTINNEMIIKSRMFLSIEQFRNEKVAKLLSFHQFDFIVSNYQKIFDNLLSLNIIEEKDTYLLAFLFTSPITLIISLSDRKIYDKDKLNKLLEEYVNHFVKTYFK